MSVSEIKSQLRKLTPAERADIAEVIEQLAHKDKAAWRKEMLRRHREIKAGKGLTREAAMQRYGFTESAPK